MPQLCIPLPALRAAHTIDLAVTTDGTKRLMNFRLETVPWPAGADDATRIAHLRAFIEAYEKPWQLVQIGPSSREQVQVLFRRLA